MKFTKLRLAGFKSFVDPTELIIAPGLTGIVGPNGCGKSNIVEALRWTMGESSAKQMRGGEMDDVIFNGTADRPARNIAEVTLSLDNSARTAPAQFNDDEEIEVSRRIERDKGSNYRVNSREVRARDVQVMFADLATGARSTALVSQGRIGALISAKPAGRRLLLEEAAGITGLHSRRHEAELRLRAAETNLERLDDVLQTLDDQLQGLKKQARQAKRYRTVADRIRRAEAVVLHQRWAAANGRMDEARAGLAAAEAKVAELTGRVAVATNAREREAGALPELRQAEAEAAAELQRLTLARGELEAEERRLEAAQEQCAARLADLGADTEREQTLGGDAARALARLAAEAADIEAAQAGETDALRHVAGSLAAADAAVGELEAEYGDITRRIAADEARRAALDREVSELEGRIARLRGQLSESEAERAKLAADGGDDPVLRLAETELAHTQAALDDARERLETAEAERATAQDVEEKAREARQLTSETNGRLRAEETALLVLVRSEADGAWTPLLDEIEVEPGYEAALGAALGDDLQASADPEAPRHWRDLPPLADARPLPAGVEHLAAHVHAPAALGRRLSQIGIAADSVEARRLVEALRPGQRLVTRDGGLWRWDGFTTAIGAADAAEKRLRHRNRLTDLHAELERAEKALGAAAADLEDVRQASEAAAERVRGARKDLRVAEAGFNALRQRHGALLQQAAALGSRREALVEMVTRLEADLGEAEERLRQATAERDGLGEFEARRAHAAELGTHLEEARQLQTTTRSTHERATRDAEDRGRRRAAIAEEQQVWQARKDGAGRRIAELEQRQAAAKAEQAQLAARPTQINEQRRALIDSIEAAEARRRAAADRLAVAETRLKERERALKSVEAEHMEAREARVRAEALVAQEEQAQETLRERIAERLECLPEETLRVAEIRDRQDLPDLQATEARLERLLRERDNIGPVNLRAEREAEELDQQIATMLGEREDLFSAIARLRQGIASLNREARERLMASFGEVNRHFQELFTRLFGGGKARLEMIEADDPLEAGLEVLASPPGKRLQSMSLLSGGEQALTATALLFAVFLTNPAPICVLDEVDAPLDDANVDRFCTMLEDIARSSETRFLLVTHHRMTMARMDRLYGVTMPERGVSQLVSVDLRSAEALQQTA